MTDLKNYITNWQKEYQHQSSKIPLFNQDVTSKFTDNQKQKFAKLFYHIRGHFYKFLWFLGSKEAGENTIEMKIIILQNISEEFGKQKSHEQMYLDFASSLGVEIIENEIIKETSNLDFIKMFNQQHLEFILKDDSNSAWAAFSAYEALDNLDYENLLNLVIPWNPPPKALVFFKVHAKVSHHQTTEEVLQKIWNKDPKSVQKGFEFIASHQLKMWQDLYEEVMK